jgi:S-adenosylmethionine:tRNA ribosyltransferase-isomerase
LPHHINIDDYDYPLPEERIARYPLAQRDASKQLIYRDGKITEQPFHRLSEQLPEESLLVFNNTRVIHARLRFALPNGRPLEILCLEPVSPRDYQQNLSSMKPVEWKCMVGGNRKWKSGEITQPIATRQGEVTLSARRGEWLGGPFLITFSWDQPQLSFGELLVAGGIIPLPPYLKRDSEADDHDRYQTIYAEPEGSVAAPTAGLHFTPEVFAELDRKGVQRAFVTLHVGAGTFKPVTTDRLGEHEMHRENIFVERSLLSALQKTLQTAKPVIPVGTTSMRTLESLYWLGVRQINGGTPLETGFVVEQWEPYETSVTALPTALEAITALLKQLEENDLDLLEGYTQLLIAPGYPNRLVSGLITNFHQPRSTLLLLVASLIGEDWKKVYEYALAHDFRFLSYGDSSYLSKR